MYHTDRHLQLVRLLHLFPAKNDKYRRETAFWHTKRIDRFFYTLGAFIMPKDSYQSWNKSEPLRFVECMISEEQEAEFAVWCEEQESDDFVPLIVLTSEGWKFSITPKENATYFVASIHMLNEKSRDYNAFLSAQAEEAIEAVKLLLFKVTVLLKGKPLPYTSKRKHWG
jgi:hypothetical protein